MVIQGPTIIRRIRVGGGQNLHRGNLLILVLKGTSFFFSEQNKNLNLKEHIFKRLYVLTIYVGIR